MIRRVSAVMPAGKGPVSMFAFKVLAGTADAEAKHALRSRVQVFRKARVSERMLSRMRKMHLHIPHSATELASRVTTEHGVAQVELGRGRTIS